MLVAVGVGIPGAVPSNVDRVLVQQARDSLRTLTVVAERTPRTRPYRREAFGPPWTDAAAVGKSGNGCDTRNDVLARDLDVAESVAAQSCPTAVAAGTFRSPYTGRQIDFRRGNGSRAVQIDHIVPLSFAWDMGAADWPTVTRIAFANDPANLVAVDAASNQAKSDLEPGRWMPELRGFWCQYAVAFVRVSAAYELRIDARSRDVLAAALDDC